MDEVEAEITGGLAEMSGNVVEGSLSTTRPSARLQRGTLISRPHHPGDAARPGNGRRDAGIPLLKSHAYAAAGSCSRNTTNHRPIRR
jgi:hypothetical protein